jgi:hypothetical protein
MHLSKKQSVAARSNRPSLAVNKEETTIEERANRAYLRHCERNGFIADQPSRDMTVVTRRCVILSNDYRELARYETLTTSGGKTRLRKA